MEFWFMEDDNLVKTKFVIHKYDSYLDKIKFVTVLTAFLMLVYSMQCTYMLRR